MSALMEVIRFRILIQEFFKGFFIFTIARQGILHNFAYMSGESDWIFMKILSQMYPWTRKSPLNFGSNPDPNNPYPSPDPESGFELRGPGPDLPWRTRIV